VKYIVEIENNEIEMLLLATAGLSIAPNTPEDFRAVLLKFANNLAVVTGQEEIMAGVLTSLKIAAGLIKRD